MDTLKNIQGVIFDYGGTIDTNSCHWAEVLWTKYMEHQENYAKAGQKDI